MIGLRSGNPGATIPGASGVAGYKFPAVDIVKNMTFAIECGCYTWLGNRWAKEWRENPSTVVWSPMMA